MWNQWDTSDNLFASLWDITGISGQFMCVCVVRGGGENDNEKGKGEEGDDFQNSRTWLCLRVH